MAFDVSIVIKAESQLEAVKAAEQAVNKLGQTSGQSNKEADRATRLNELAAQSYHKLSGATEKTVITQRNLGSAVTVVASQVGGLGAIANLASNAITTMTLASGPAGIALAGLAATVGFLVYRIEQARENLRRIAEIELAVLNREIRGLKLEQDIRSQIKVIQSLTPEIEEARQSMAKLRIEAEKLGVASDKINQLERLTIGEAARRRAEAVRQEIVAARVQAQLAGDITQKRAIELQLQQRILEIETQRRPEAEKQLLIGAARDEAVNRLSILEKQMTDHIRAQIDALKVENATLEKSREDAADYRLQVELTQIARRTGIGVLNEEQQKLVQNLRAEQDRNRAIKERNADLERGLKALSETEQFFKDAQAVRERDTTREIDRQRQLADARADLLESSGASPLQSAAARQQAILDELQRKRDAVSEHLIEGNLDVLDAQIEAANARYQELGRISIDWTEQIARTGTDILNAAISGTLRLADVGKSALLGLGRAVLDSFGEALKQKFRFETVLFDNLRGLPGQMQNAFASGGASIGPLNGNGGGILNLLGGLFGGGGTNPGLFSTFPNASGITQLDPANTTFSTGSFTSAGGLLSNLLPAGSTLGGLLGAGFGGFGIGNLINPRGGGGIGGLIGGIGGSLIGSSTAIGTALGLSGSLTSSLTGTLTGVLGGTLGGLLGAMVIPGIGAIIGALISLFFKKKEPRTRANVSTQFGGISLGPLGLELGDITSIATGKGKGFSSSIGGQTGDIVSNAVGGIIGALNFLPREILQGLPFGQFTGAIGGAGSFSVNVRQSKFRDVVNEVLAEIPANIFHVMQPLFKQAIEEQARRVGFPALSAQAGAFITAINPLFNAPQGPNEPKIKLTEQAISSLGGVIQFLNTLQGVRPFASARERGLLEAGAGQVLGAGLDTQKAIERFGQQFGGVLQAVQERQRFLSDIVSQSIAKGLEDAATQGAGFDFFFRSFGDAFSQTIQDSMARAFLEQQIQPLIAGRFADIMDIFGGIGPGRTAEEALALAQPQITSLTGELGALRPVFDAMLQLIRDLQSQIRGQFGGGDGVKTDQPITININGADDPRESVRRIEAFFRTRRVA